MQVSQHRSERYFAKRSSGYDVSLKRTCRSRCFGLVGRGFPGPTAELRLPSTKPDPGNGRATHRTIEMASKRMEGDTGEHSNERANPQPGA